MSPVKPAKANHELLGHTTQESKTKNSPDKAFQTTVQAESLFCEHAKELWCKSDSKGKDFALTNSSRLCALDSWICVNWNTEHRHNCPTLKLYRLGRIPSPKSVDL